MTLHFCLTLDEDGRWRLVDDSNCEWELGLYYKLAGGKCKYLLYVASADALTNRRRWAANIVRVLCQSEEGDHVAY